MLSLRRTRSYIFFLCPHRFHAATDRQDDFDGNLKNNKDLRADLVAPNYGGAKKKGKAV